MKPPRFQILVILGAIQWAWHAYGQEVPKSHSTTKEAAYDIAAENLIRAARENDLAGIERAKGTHWPGSDRTWMQAATVAAAAGHFEILQAIVAREDRFTRLHSNLDNCLQQSPLWFAAARGDDRIIEWLVEVGAEIDSRTFSGQTPLMVAADLGHESTVRLLLKKGASINARAINGWMPLDFARRSGSKAVVEILEKSGGKSGATTGIATELPTTNLREETKLPAGVPPPSVAWAPLRIDDAFYASLIAGDNLWGAVESQLLSSPGVDWVERRDLERIAGEWAIDSFAGRDTGTVLTKGRLARADWIITGHIAPDEGRGRLLTIDVLDTRSAERLARQAILLSGPLGQSLAFDQDRILAVSQAVHAALGEAASSARRGSGARRLASLFFVSDADSDRLDSLATRAEAALSFPAKTGVHVMQFREAGLASSEAQLAADEWLKGGAQGFYYPADAFVWGTVREIGNREAPFPEVQIRFEWQIWDGIGEPRLVAADCRVADAEQTLTVLSGQVLEALRSAKFHAVTPEMRRNVARRLAEQSKALRLTKDYPRNPTAVRQWRHRLSLIESAHFFLPEDPEIEALTLVERGHRVHFAPSSYGARGPMHFRAEWERHDDWGTFVERLGFEPLRAALKDSGRFLQAWPSAAVFGNSSGAPVESRFVHLTTELRHGIEEMGTGLPLDTPASVRRRWLDEVASEFGRRLNLAAESSDGKLDLKFDFYRANFQNISDPTERFRAMAIAWGEVADWGRVKEKERSSFQAELIATAKAAGLSAELNGLLARSGFAESPREKPPMKVTEANPNLPPESNKMDISAGDEPRVGNQGEILRWWETRLKSRFETQAEFPGWIPSPFRAFTIAAEGMAGSDGAETWEEIETEGAWIETPERRLTLSDTRRYARVERLASWAGKLWIAGWSHRGPSIWEHDPDTSGFRRLPDPPALPDDPGNPIDVFLVHDTGIWLARRDLGLWQFDWNSESWRHFGVKDGLPSNRLRCGTASVETVFFGAGGDDDGSLTSWDPKTESWRVFRRPGDGPERMGQVREIHARRKNEILVYEWFPDRSKPRIRGSTFHHRYHRFSPGSGIWTELTAMVDRTRLHSSIPFFDGDRHWAPWTNQLKLGSWDSGQVRAVQPAVVELRLNGRPSVSAARDGWFWTVVHDRLNRPLDESINGARLYAVHTKDAEIRGATCLPVMGTVSSAAACGDRLWIGLRRPLGEPATLIALPLKMLTPAKNP